ncbi:protein RKD4 [Cocos nucifera]|uniref:Protein RKD4 n=1 Tax=Cocos nucifera TaxID=13894 RepID=A0A8K0IUN8_COCNU|nr:protein RKD4 [Cocos nucifera]
MGVMEKLKIFVVQEPVVAASCLIAGVGLFLPAVVRPILDSFESAKQVPQPALSDSSKASTSCFSVGMDSEHPNSLMMVDEKDSFWALLGDPLPHVPPLQWWSETEALVPFPESLDQIDDVLHGNISIPDNSVALVPYQHHSPPPINELGLGDINLDSSFTRHVNYLTPHCGDVISDIAPLNLIASSNGVYDGKISYNYNYPFEISQVDQVGERNIERRTIRRPRSTDIGFDEIKNYFCMPITRAAKEMNVGLTVLKNRCRELGINRWPHRKMKSLMTLIHNVQELGKGEESMREVEILEEHRRLLEENPEMELSESTKKLRQAYFKAHYKRRKALRNHCLDIRN